MKKFESSYHYERGNISSLHLSCCRSLSCMPISEEFGIGFALHGLRVQIAQKSEKASSPCWFNSELFQGERAKYAAWRSFACNGL